MAKRSATSALNENNWDKEDEPEKPELFNQASSDILEHRVIKTAKRRIQVSGDGNKPKQSPFSGFAGFGKSSSTSSSPFSFLNQNTLSKIDAPKSQDSVSNLKNEGLNKDVIGIPFSNFQQSKSTNSQSDSTFKPFEHIFKSSETTKINEKKSETLETLKELNKSCSSWINKHLESNPYCILTPIFKDYEKHLIELKLNSFVEKEDCKVENKNLNVNENHSSEFERTTTITSEKASEESQTQSGKSSNFQFGAFPSAKPITFQFNSGANTETNSSSTPFSLNQLSSKPLITIPAPKADDEESEEPPKNDFVPVVEEDSIFDMKCKVFVKKNSEFVTRGVGTLFLKEIKDSKKTQMIVRAHTNLGNILLNIILTPGMPIQKTGKNNAMIVCIPTPEAKPPPVPVLIRVKTSEDCDTLIKKLEQCRDQ